MKKDKTKKKSVEKKAAASKPTSIDTALAVNLLERIKKFWKEPEYITLHVSDTMEISAEFPSAKFVVRDEKAIVEKGSDFTARVSYAVLKATLKGRGKVAIQLKDGEIHVDGSRYSATLNVEAASRQQLESKDKGLDVSALSECLGAMGDKLAIWDYVNESNVDVHFAWGPEGINAGVAANAHAMVVVGKHESKKKGSITLPLETAKQLSDIGGNFLLTDVDVFAQNENAQMEMRRTNEITATHSLTSILGLLERKILWTATLNGAELASLLSSLSMVTDGNSNITLKIGDVIKIDAKGRYGSVKGTIEFNTIKGKPPKEILLNPRTFIDILSKFEGPLKFSALDNMVRLEKATLKEKKGDAVEPWMAVGFVSQVAA